MKMNQDPMDMYHLTIVLLFADSIIYYDSIKLHINFYFLDELGAVKYSMPVLVSTRVSVSVCVCPEVLSEKVNTWLHWLSSVQAIKYLWGWDSP